MMIPLLLLCQLVLLAAAIDVRRNMVESGYKVHKMREGFFVKLRDELQELEVDVIGRDAGIITFRIESTNEEALSNLPAETEEITDAWIQETQANLDNPNLFCNDESSACAARSQQDFFSSYQGYDALIARIESLVANAPGLATIKTIGTSYEGRDINIVEIGDQSKPLGYFMCTVHAREWLSAMYCPYMIEKLLENGGHPLLDTFSFAILPYGNPDGFIYSYQVDSMWRKTRNYNSARPTCFGTDPNRNYDNNHCGPGTSNNPCSQIYCGPSAFSTPEVAAINDYALTVQDRLITWTDYHSFASVWLSPLGYTFGVPPAQDYNRMAQCMSAATRAATAATGERFFYGGAADILGPAAGASDDYFYLELGVIYSYTVEMRGNSFQPPPSNIDPNNLEMFAGTVAQMECIAQIEGLRTLPDNSSENEVETNSSTDGKSFGLGLLAGLGVAIVGLFGLNKCAFKKEEEEEVAGAPVTREVANGKASKQATVGHFL